jgi:hypothetical protein
MLSPFVYKRKKKVQDVQGTKSGVMITSVLSRKIHLQVSFGKRKKKAQGECRYVGVHGEQTRCGRNFIMARVKEL